MTHTRKLIIAGITAFALSAGAVGIAQAVGGESDTSAAGPQSGQAAQVALDVVKRGEVVSINHDNAGKAAWAVRVFKPAEPLESFDKGPAVGRHIVVYLDRDLNWLQAKVEGYGPRN